jgi:curved DNA-binding protein CbpA
MSELPEEDANDLERLRDWAEILEDSNYYEILDLLELADDDAIRASFKTFSLAFHPDMHLDSPEEYRHLARRIFQRGAEAYRVLSDPTLRSAYDLALAQGRLRLVEGATSRAPPASPGSKSGAPTSAAPRARTLEDVARTPAAKLSASKAERDITLGDFESARRYLKEALAQDDYENAELEERIEGLDVAIFAKGERSP